jgi:hypothetical protein
MNKQSESIRNGRIEYSTIKLVSIGRICRPRERASSELAQKGHASGNSSIFFIAKVMQALYRAVDSSLDCKVSSSSQYSFSFTRRSQQSRISMNGFKMDVLYAVDRPRVLFTKISVNSSTMNNFPPLRLSRLSPLRHFISTRSYAVAPPSLRQFRSMPKAAPKQRILSRQNIDRKS